MKRILSLLIICGFTTTVCAQTVNERLAQAFKNFEDDTQLRSALSSLYVIESKTGNVIFDKNSRIGLAPASTQKIITSATAYELLGKDFTYKTELSYANPIINGVLQGRLIITPSGDPTLGSWRWLQTKEDQVASRIVNAVKKAGIKSYAAITVDNRKWNTEAIPDGWIWQDIANYYGAGATGLNWRENQYDLFLSSGAAVGSKVVVEKTKPWLYRYSLESQATAGAKGSGDNAYIYFPLDEGKGVIRGTIPAGETNFTISGALPDPNYQFTATIDDSLKHFALENRYKNVDNPYGDDTKRTVIHTEVSPPLDSIVYWFNRKSINLYGEALVKTFAFQKKGMGDTDEGVDLVRDFWKGKGIEAIELNMVDGSGLSPLNRVTTHAQVTVLQHAQKQSWYSGYYLSLPEYNGMKMKSGTIRGVKAYCGYHKAKDGTEYVFSFLVNNYNGSASSLIQKMYKVLDVLK
ncbi:D-alanyl-D-alanine carboxypeptidase/D-alanyl-D-alanine-endopeptidase [Flavisolibacter tropicus]|uniref:D-alanyl-D-alanine carboxypeptidase n=1 Tax=Flavisolibacter tropicus TaxID=1492898 RepID=A0A172TSP4_9BACT|nr:D-alanyl-D-alanine carboxypeptidase/D-alanyl-D-alanine-endopeptidase [Flavisolibacter tropicus]ANE49904.1 D-alanyl-D-alanine carboxypeptidase [Flavisolibacter tropicus]